MTDVAELEPVFANSLGDRIVRARKRRQCQCFRGGRMCPNWIEPGHYYLDHNPPMRQQGYYARSIECALRGGLVRHRSQGG